MTALKKINRIYRRICQIERIYKEKKMYLKKDFSKINYEFNLIHKITSKL